MKVAYTSSITFKVENRINKMPSKVILYSDLSNLAAKRQINRALKRLMEKQKIARISKGVYVKLRPSVIDESITLDGSFEMIAKEVLDKLGVPWQEDVYEEQYRSGKSTQIPLRPKTYINARVNRKIQWQDKILQYESKTKRA